LFYLYSFFFCYFGFNCIIFKTYESHFLRNFIKYACIRLNFNTQRNWTFSNFIFNFMFCNRYGCIEYLVQDDHVNFHILNFPFYCFAICIFSSFVFSTSICFKIIFFFFFFFFFFFLRWKIKLIFFVNNNLFFSFISFTYFNIYVFFYL